jgi:hypothetical protein
MTTRNPYSRETINNLNNKKNRIQSHRTRFKVQSEAELYDDSAFAITEHFLTFLELTVSTKYFAFIITKKGKREHKGRLKGLCHEIFDPRCFSSNNTPWAPDSRAKAFWNSASNSPRHDRFSNAKIVHVVSMTPRA